MRTIVPRWLCRTLGIAVLALVGNAGHPSDAATDVVLANLIQVDFVGCKDLQDNDCKPLATFRFDYAWESAEKVQSRLTGGEGGTPRAPSRATSWTSFKTEAKGRAALPLPPDPSQMNVLHVRLKEPGWDWFTFPGPVHPGTLEGAAAFELQPGGRALRLTLVVAK